MNPMRSHFIALLATCVAGLAQPTFAADSREASTQARLASCDPAVVHAAADQVLRDPATLRDPLLLIHAAAGERMIGSKEQAVFLYLAGWLRSTRQALYEKHQKGKSAQLYTVMIMEAGPLMSPVLESDPELAQRVVKRVIDWDRSTPDPFRERAAAVSGDIRRKLAEIDAGLARLPGQLRDDPARVDNARAAVEETENLIKTSYAERCKRKMPEPPAPKLFRPDAKAQSAQAFAQEPVQVIVQEPAQAIALEPAQPVVQKPACAFPGLKFPADFAVFAAGAYAGRETAFQIDQSGHEATQIDVAVNSPDKPVALMLGAYEPTIWNISWSERTRIVAVLVGGYHRQAVAGLEKGTPLLNSSYDNKGPCGSFYVTLDALGPLNPLSKRVFGRPVDMVYPASKGSVVVGERLAAGTRMVASDETTVASFLDKSAPLAGPAGLEDAVRRGLLRKATAADAEAWSDAVAQNSRRDIPPVAGQGVPKPPGPPLYNSFVVLGPFTYPAGLYGGNLAYFLIPKGVPKPKGDPGHSAVYDFNTLSCQGVMCTAR